jgi:hypothetical protein
MREVTLLFYRGARDASLQDFISKLSARVMHVRGSGLVHIFLSTIIILNSEIACDGFSPFGQALAQFIMVWQR